MANNSMLKVLHIIPSISPLRGGPSKAVIDMVRSLNLAGVNAEIATTNDDGEKTFEIAAENIAQCIDYQGVPVRFFQRFSPNVSAIREFAYSTGFKKWLKTNISNYDVIHIHAIFSFCSTYAMTLARKRQIPYIVRPIGQLESWSLTQSKWRKKLYLQIIESANLKGAGAIHFTAESEKKQALKTLSLDNSRVIPLGIDITKPIIDAKQQLQNQWALEEHIPIILFLSRLHPKKGIENLLNALSQLTEQPFYCLIAGDGESTYKTTLIQLTSSLNLNEKCHFVGFVNGHNKSILLQGADLFALTSHSENFGIAALEAMAAGTAVMISKQVALSTLVDENKLGYTTSLETEEILITLKTALSNLENTKKMGQNGHLYADQNFKWSMVTEQLIELYNQVK
ncbi:MAG: glycosyltransferase [Acidiferrobacterales bacterium]|nr:glycosyltransferase [Acidiferrobacterales bacterium]